VVMTAAEFVHQVLDPDDTSIFNATHVEQR
jgi:hypothetical protein